MAPKKKIANKKQKFVSALPIKSKLERILRVCDLTEYVFHNNMSDLHPALVDYRHKVYDQIRFNDSSLLATYSGHPNSRILVLEYRGLHNFLIGCAYGIEKISCDFYQRSFDPICVINTMDSYMRNYTKKSYADRELLGIILSSENLPLYASTHTYAFLLMKGIKSNIKANKSLFNINRVYETLDNLYSEFTFLLGFNFVREFPAFEREFSFESSAMIKKYDKVIAELQALPKKTEQLSESYSKKEPEELKIGKISPILRDKK